MIGTIRKHSTWLWFVIIAFTILSFVVFGPTNSRMGNIFTELFSGGSEGEFGSIGGKPVSVTEFRNAYNEVALGAFLQSRKWPADPQSFQMKRETYMRLFLIEKQEELGIEISIDAVAAQAAKILGGMPPMEFVDKVLRPVGLEEADFSRYLHHQIGLDQLMRSTGVTGLLVTPQEAETMYRQENQQIEAEMAHFQASNYLARVPVTPAALGQFYSNELANYRIPEKVQVQYVKINVTNYFGEVTSKMTNEAQINQVIDNYARENFGTNLYPNTHTLDESRAAIRMAFVKTNALLYAQRAASDFAIKLSTNLPRNPDGFRQLAAASKLTVQNLDPFAREFGPEDLDVPPKFASDAFALSPDEPFSGSIPAADGVYVLAYVGRVPEHIPTLKEIEPKVTADFREATAIQMAQQDSIKLANLVNDPTNGLASGKSFAALCAQSGVKASTLPPFAANTRSLPDEIEHDIDLNTLKQMAFSVPPGRASSPASAHDGAFLIYVIRQLPVDEAKLKTELPGFMTYIRQVRENDAFNQWFNAQARLDQPFVMHVQRLAEQMQGTARRRSGS